MLYGMTTGSFLVMARPEAAPEWQAMSLKHREGISV